MGMTGQLRAAPHGPEDHQGPHPRSSQRLTLELRCIEASARSALATFEGDDQAQTAIAERALILLANLRPKLGALGAGDRRELTAAVEAASARFRAQQDR
jgi:hypothetical protein